MKRQAWRERLAALREGWSRALVWGLIVVTSPVWLPGWLAGVVCRLLVIGFHIGFTRVFTYTDSE